LNSTTTINQPSVVVETATATTTAVLTETDYSVAFSNLPGSTQTTTEDFTLLLTTTQPGETTTQPGITPPAQTILTTLPPSTVILTATPAPVTATYTPFDQTQTLPVETSIVYSTQVETSYLTVTLPQETQSVPFTLPAVTFTPPAGTTTATVTLSPSLIASYITVTPPPGTTLVQVTPPPETTVLIETDFETATLPQVTETSIPPPVTSIVTVRHAEPKIDVSFAC
jgi:hypothetical protein